MTTSHEPYPDAAYEQHLADEREQDRLAEGELEPPEETGATPAPPARRVPGLTAVLGGLLIAFVFLLAGIQLQKLLGGSAPAPAPTGGGGSRPSDEDGLTAGRIIAVRGNAIYVREADGQTVKLRTASDSRVALGRPAPPSAIRPGQEVVVESAPRTGGEDTALSVTVVPPRERDGP
jgi:hypothetical protein